MPLFPFAAPSTYADPLASCSEEHTSLWVQIQSKRLM